MTPRPLRGSRVPARGDDLDDFHDIWGGTVIHGHVEAMHLPYGLLDEEAEVLKREIEEQLARRRPPGFTARWDEPADLRRVA